MPEEPLHQPHDKLFKSAFGDPATAAGFLRWEIPAALSSAIDWENLRLEPGSFVDSHYRHSESDLLFSSTPDRHPHIAGDESRTARQAP